MGRILTPEQKERQAASQSRWAHVATWVTSNKERIDAYHDALRKQRNALDKAYRDNLADSYIRGMLKTGNAVTPELIELKRVQLQITRYLRG